MLRLKKPAKWSSAKAPSFKRAMNARFCGVQRKQTRLRLRHPRSAIPSIPSIASIALRTPLSDSELTVGVHRFSAAASPLPCPTQGFQPSHPRLPTFCSLPSIKPHPSQHPSHPTTPNQAAAIKNSRK